MAMMAKRMTLKTESRLASLQAAEGSKTFLLLLLHE